MEAPSDDREWGGIRDTLSHEDRTRVEALGRRGRAAERDDEAILVIAFAKHALRRAWLGAVVMFPILLAAIFVLQYGSMEAALRDPYGLLFFPVVYPIVHTLASTYRLHRAVVRNMEVILRASRRVDEPLPTPPGMRRRQSSRP